MRSARTTISTRPSKTWRACSSWRSGVPCCRKPQAWARVQRVRTRSAVSQCSVIAGGSYRTRSPAATRVAATVARSKGGISLRGTGSGGTDRDAGPVRAFGTLAGLSWAKRGGLATRARGGRRVGPSQRRAGRLVTARRRTSGARRRRPAGARDRRRPEPSATSRLIRRRIPEAVAGEVVGERAGLARRRGVARPVGLARAGVVVPGEGRRAGAGAVVLRGAAVARGAGGREGRGGQAERKAGKCRDEELAHGPSPSVGVVTGPPADLSREYGRGGKHHGRRVAGARP